MTEVRRLQYEKAYSPMEVTEEGIVTDVRPRLIEKANSPMEVTELGILYAPSNPSGYRIKIFLSLENKTPSMLE